MNPTTTTTKKRKADANAMRQPFLGSMNHGPPFGLRVVWWRNVEVSGNATTNVMEKIV